MSNESKIDASLIDQKLRSEIEKVQLENAKLRESAWRSPAILISLGTLMLSVLGNVFQYNSAQTSAAYSERQMTLAESKWRDERERLHADLAEAKLKSLNREADRTAIQEEVERLNKDIALWDTAILQDNLRLIGMKNKLLEYKANKLSEMAIATKKNIAILETGIKVKTDERSAAVSRRSELERRSCG